MSNSSSVCTLRNSVTTHSVGLFGQQLVVELVGRWPVCRGGPAHRKDRPRGMSNHIDELLVRLPLEATPALAQRRQFEDTPPTSRRSGQAAL